MIFSPAIANFADISAGPLGLTVHTCCSTTSIQGLDLLSDNWCGTSHQLRNRKSATCYPAIMQPLS